MATRTTNIEHISYSGKSQHGCTKWALGTLTPLNLTVHAYYWRQGGTANTGEKLTSRDGEMQGGGTVGQHIAPISSRDTTPQDSTSFAGTIRIFAS